MHPDAHLTIHRLRTEAASTRPPQRPPTPRPRPPGRVRHRLAQLLVRAAVRLEGGPPPVAVRRH